MSFAAEMRDFVAAWTAVSDMGNKKKQLDLQKQEIENLKAYRDETLAIDREQLELSRLNSNRSYALARARAANSRESEEAAKAAKEAERIYDGLGELEDSAAELDWSWDTQTTGQPSPPAPTSPEPPAAIPENPMTNFQEDYGNYSRGGLVARAAGGGIMQPTPTARAAIPVQAPGGFEEDFNWQGDPEPVAPAPAPARKAAPSAIPAAPSTPSSPAAPPAAPPALAADPEAKKDSRSEAAPDPKAAESVASSAQEAIKDAATALVEDFNKPDAAVGPDSEKMDIVSNQGGMSMDEWKQLIQAIDPNDSIPAYLKSAAALASTHRYFMENGQPEKAQRVAKGILILNKQMTQTLGALAENAMQDGDIPAAARFLSDAGNQFPTGHQFQIDPTENGLTYTIMQNGKEVETGQLSTAQLWELTGKVRDGSLFIEEMGRIAGGSKERQRVGPEQAMDLVADAFSRASQARDALDLAIQEGADPEEQNKLRQEAQRAASTYRRFYNNALQMGLKRTDLDARKRDFQELALPDAQQPEDGILSAQESGVTQDGNIVEFDNLPTPRTKAERDALPPGTQYVAPDGSIRTR